MEQPERIYYKKQNKRINRGNCFYLMPSSCRFYGVCPLKQLAEEKKQRFLDIQRAAQGYKKP